MKEFNLEKALAGEPVALRNGDKGVALLRRRKPFTGNLKYIAFWALSPIFFTMLISSTISARIILKLSTRLALQDINEIIATLEQKAYRISRDQN